MSFKLSWILNSWCFPRISKILSRKLDFETSGHTKIICFAEELTLIFNYNRIDIIAILVSGVRLMEGLWIKQAGTIEPGFELSEWVQNCSYICVCNLRHRVIPVPAGAWIMLFSHVLGKQRTFIQLITILCAGAANISAGCWSSVLSMPDKYLSH